MKTTRFTVYNRDTESDVRGYATRAGARRAARRLVESTGQSHAVFAGGASQGPERIRRAVIEAWRVDDRTVVQAVRS